MKTIMTPSQRNILINQYSEPGRVYHSLEHILIMFQLASAHGVRLSVPQQLAIWWHDAVYFPGLVENEIRSAEMMKREMESNCWISKELVNRAYNIILETTHLTEVSDNETQVVLDLDLAGLGFDSDSYSYAKYSIRAEYGYLSDEDWSKGRIKFLTSMLNKPFIFYTSWGRDFYEKKARRNMQEELDSLMKTL